LELGLELAGLEALLAGRPRRWAGMAARELALLLLAAPMASASADCAGAECAAEGDDSALLAHRSLLARRTSGSSSSKKKKGKDKCKEETGSMGTLVPNVAPGWSALAVEGGVGVSLVVGTASNVEIVVDEGLASFVDASVSGDTLTIKFSPPCEDVDKDPKITVTTPELPTAISATNDAQVEFPKWPFEMNSQTVARVESMSLTATDDAQIQLKKVEVAGSLTISTDTDGDVNTQWTVSSQATVTAKDDSQVEGGSTTTLTVDITDDSQVKYYVLGSAEGSVTDDSELKVKVMQGAAKPDVSGVTTDETSKLKID